MAQRVLIIKAGKIIADESLNTLLTGAEGEQEIVIRMNGDGDDAVRKIRDLRLPGVETVEVRKLQQSLESVFIKLNE
jgi:ABC-type multidrug transport system ATPase subunit